MRQSTALPERPSNPCAPPGVVGKAIAAERKLWSGVQKIDPAAVRQARFGDRCADFFLPAVGVAIELLGVHDMRGAGPRIDDATAERHGVRLLHVHLMDVLSRSGEVWWMLHAAGRSSGRARFMQRRAHPR